MAARKDEKWPSNSDKRGNAAKPIKEVPMDEYDEGVRYFDNHPLTGRDMWITSADIKIHVTDVWLDCGEIYIGGNVGDEAFYALADLAQTIH